MNQPWSSLAVPPDAIIGVLNAVFQRWPDPGMMGRASCCRIWRGLIGEKQILIRIWSNFLVPSLPDTSLCEAQGDGGGPAISCRVSGERQIGREDRRKIDMIRRAAGSEPC